MSSYISKYIFSFTNMSGYVTVLFFAPLCNRISNPSDLLPTFVTAFNHLDLLHAYKIPDVITHTFVSINAILLRFSI